VYAETWWSIKILHCIEAYASAPMAVYLERRHISRTACLNGVAPSLMVLSCTVPRIVVYKSSRRHAQKTIPLTCGTFFRSMFLIISIHIKASAMTPTPAASILVCA